MENMICGFSARFHLANAVAFSGQSERTRVKHSSYDAWRVHYTAICPLSEVCFLYQPGSCQIWYPTMTHECCCVGDQGSVRCEWHSHDCCCVAWYGELWITNAAVLHGMEMREELDVSDIHSWWREEIGVVYVRFGAPLWTTNNRACAAVLHDMCIREALAMGHIHSW